MDTIKKEQTIETLVISVITTQKFTADIMKNNPFTMHNVLNHLKKHTPQLWCNSTEYSGMKQMFHAI